jgi:hypothetical protein
VGDWGFPLCDAKQREITAKESVQFVVTLWIHAIEFTLGKIQNRLFAFNLVKVNFLSFFLLSAGCLPCFPWPAFGEEAPPLPVDKAGNATREIGLPGIKLNLEERSIDVNATVCLHEGLLELVACVKDSKEHESIVVLNARPIHIHTALLLLRAKPGTPAMQQVLDEESTRWIPVPPAGDPIEVSLVFPDAKGKLGEHPISKFVSPAQMNGFDEVAIKEKPKAFPFSFLFAGSHLLESKEGPRKYACEYSGNVISISTFGDELLCLPGIHGHQNAGLAWQVNPEGLPDIGTAVILRLRPKDKNNKQ